MFYTNKVKKFVDGNVYAVDIFFPEDGMMKTGSINCINDVKKLPENELDCVIMMDVLEHMLNVIFKKRDFKGNEDKWFYSEKHIITVTVNSR
jgi:hypothetical protein